MVGYRKVYFNQAFWLNQAKRGIVRPPPGTLEHGPNERRHAVGKSSISNKPSWSNRQSRGSANRRRWMGM